MSERKPETREIAEPTNELRWLKTAETEYQLQQKWCIWSELQVLFHAPPTWQKTGLIAEEWRPVPIAPPEVVRESEPLPPAA